MNITKLESVEYKNVTVNFGDAVVLYRRYPEGNWEFRTLSGRWAPADRTEELEQLYQEFINIPPSQETKELAMAALESKLPYHLRKDSTPVSQCTKCGRKSWDETAGSPCCMPQPSGAPCQGILVSTSPR